MWNRIWYQPINAARGWLLARAVLLLLAADAWLLMIPRAALYGSSGFNVAHFAWLDAIQPLPSAGLYILVLLWIGLLAFAAAVGTTYRWVLAAIALLYTYAWSISLLDSYQHHYLLSWLLICLALLPREDTEANSHRRVAWSFQLIGVIVTVVYTYAAVSKLDDGWRSGSTAARWLGGSPIAGWIEASDLATWGRFSWCIIVGELLLAAGYLAAVCRGEARGRYDWLWRWTFFVMAVSLHAGIEMAGLRIGWFSFYMMMVAGAFFLPGTWLSEVHRSIGRLARRWDRLPKPTRAISQVAILAISVLCIIAVSQRIELPGFRLAVTTATLAAVLVLAVAWKRDRLCPWRRWATRLTLACAVMALTLRVSSVQFEFFSVRGQDLQARGQWRQAVDVLGGCSRWQHRADPRQRAQWQHALAIALRQLGRNEEAIESFRRSVAWWPEFAAAHYHLGNLYQQLGRIEEARAAYLSAIDVDSDFARAYHNLATLDAEAGKLQRATKLFERALRVEPGFAEAHKNLGKLWLLRRDLDRARSCFQASVDHDPSDAEAHHLVGTLWDLDGDLEKAGHHYEMAVRLQPDLVTAIFNLGTVYARQDRFDKAIGQFQKVLEIDPQHPSAGEAIVNVRAVRDATSR